MSFRSTTMLTTVMNTSYPYGYRRRMTQSPVLRLWESLEENPAEARGGRWKSSRDLTRPWMPNLNIKTKWGGDGQGNKIGEWRIYVGLESSIFLMSIPLSDAGWIITTHFTVPAGYIGSDLKRQCSEIKLWGMGCEKCPVVLSVLGKAGTGQSLADISLANLA